MKLGRVYFGSWTCAADMHETLRGAREHYDHADGNSYMPYPLIENDSIRILFAASPEAYDHKRPMIVIQNRDMVFTQRRSDRWWPVCQCESEFMLWPVHFNDRSALEAFRHLQRNIWRIVNVFPYVQIYQTRCRGCGISVCGGNDVCMSCTDVGRVVTWRENPGIIKSAIASSERAAVSR